MKPQLSKAAGGLLAVFILMSAPLATGTTEYPKAKVDFHDFKTLVIDVEEHRKARLISLDEFLELAEKKDVVILDTRSAFRYERIHVKGARHLNFSDFTQDNLARIIPTFETTVLIYCNNNFEGNQVDFATKAVLPPRSVRIQPAEQFAAQEKPLMMALNVPTYINLFGYGYRNVYELNELVDVSDPRISFEGSIVAIPEVKGDSDSDR
ncbi:MAG: rhodanese-like domain-containing protein [Puniceicoccaceae bacterium]